MSCSHCGFEFRSHHIIPTLFIVVCIFAVSIVVLPFEFFFIAAIIVLVGLRLVEKRISAKDSRRHTCPHCGYENTVAHIH